MRKNFIRTRYFTGSRIQLRYLSLLMISMIVPLIIVGGCLYYLIFSIAAEQIGIPEYIAYHLLPTIKKINVILFFGVPAVLFLLTVWGVILSHRFAGPMERIEKELRHIASHHDWSRRIRLRRRDDMKSVADAINELLENVEKRHK